MEILSMILVLLFFVLRVIGAIYCAQKADKLKRNSGGWAIFGLAFPIIAMIWINRLKTKIVWHENT